MNWNWSKKTNPAAFELYAYTNIELRSKAIVNEFVDNCEVQRSYEKELSRAEPRYKFILF